MLSKRESLQQCIVMDEPVISYVYLHGIGFGMAQEGLGAVMLKWCLRVDRLS